MKKAIIYIRVSTEEQVERGFSIQAQKYECINKAKGLDCQEIKVFSDEGISGSILERPGLMDAFTRLYDKDITYFICLDSSRLSRNTAHQLIITDQIKKCDCSLVFVKNSYEDSPEGRFHLTVMSAVDEYERARFQLRSELGKRAKAAQGKLTHSPNLYGYDFDKETDTLSINENEAQIISRMYRWVIEEEIGPYAIVKRLNERNIPSPRGKLWYKTTVKRILNNTAYQGTLYIRRYDARETKFNKYKKNEERVKRKEKPRIEWLPVNVPPIIESSYWEKAQKILGKARRARHSLNNNNYLLSGLLRCGLCGSTLHGNLTTNRTGKKYRYYVCTARSPGLLGKKKCLLKYIRAEDLEDPIWSQVIKWLDNPQELRGQWESGTSQKNKLAVELEELAEDLKNQKKEKERAISLYLKAFISDEEIEKRLKTIRERELQLKLQKEKLKKLLAQNKKNMENTPSFQESVLRNILVKLKELDLSDKKIIINTLIEEIEVFPTELIIKANIPLSVKSSVF